MAIGFTGEPVPLGIGSGTMSRFLSQGASFFWSLLAEQWEHTTLTEYPSMNQVERFGRSRIGTAGL
jgi:hypothetical protein